MATTKKQYAGETKYAAEVKRVVVVRTGRAVPESFGYDVQAHYARGDSVDYAAHALIAKYREAGN